MSKILTAKECTELTLLRPGLSPQTFGLPEGATLADLFREAGIGIRGPNVMIDGHPIEESIVLKSGMVITVLPDVPHTISKGSWRDTVGMFANDPTFEEMVAEGRAIREADRKATLEEMDREEAAREN